LHFHLQGPKLLPVCFVRWIQKLLTGVTMPTVADLVLEAQALQALADDQTAKSDASHAAADNVATVTGAQSALVAQAQADASVAINEAQAESDAAKAATDAATQKLDDAIAQLIADAQALAK
jgi:hypothetical protein